MFFRDERDRDFLNVCERIRKQNKGLSASQIARIAVYQQAESFHLTTRELAKIVNKVRKGHNDTRFESAASLYKEIESHLGKLRFKGASCYQAARMIDTLPAPRFYISESRAISLYYECLKKIR